MQRDIRWISDPVIDNPGERDGPSASRRPRLLVLCDFRPDEAATVIDHIEAIRRWSGNEVYVLPFQGDLPDELDLDLFDGLLIHYNVVMVGADYLSPLARWRVSQFRGVKSAMIQDEYRWVDRTVSVMRTLGINVLFTCVAQDQVDLVYPVSKLPELKRTVTILTGYVPDELVTVPVRPFEDRPMDVAYRGRRVPPWLGALAREKATIADRFAADAPAHGLRTDISNREEDRLYGTAWIEFLSRAKATLGAESGANVFDFDGSIEASVRAAMAAEPDISFDALHDRFLADVDGRVRLNQISPRAFEAAALGTLMILYPGEYSGILEPWRHYVPLQKDHSNMDEVAGALRDRATWERITGLAREEVALNPRYSYRAMLEQVDAGLDLHAEVSAPLDATAFEGIASRSLRTMLRRRRRPGGWRRVVRLVRRVGHAISPSPLAIRTVPLAHRPRGHAARELSRYLRAFLFWALRPRELPWTALVAHHGALLRDLSELARLAEFRRRAESAGTESPLTAWLDAGAREVRIVLAGERTTGDRVAADWPSDLSGLAAVQLELDEWLTPTGMGSGSRWLPALSALIRDRPDVGRRLLVMTVPQCQMVHVPAADEDAVRPPPAGAGGA